MPIEIEYRELKVLAALKNGTLFGFDPADFVDHFKGNVMEPMQLRYRVRVAWYAEIDDYRVIGANTIIRSSGTWKGDGFAKGDHIQYQGAGVVVEADIFFQDETKIILENITGGVLVNGSGLGKDIVRGLSPLTSLEFQYGFVGNEDPANYNSPLDQSTQAFSVENIGLGLVRDTSLQTGIWKNELVRGSLTGELFARFVADHLDDRLTDPGVGATSALAIQEFEIVHNVIPLAFFLNGESANIDNLIQPERFAGLNTFRNVAKTEFRTVKNNPNTSKPDEFEGTLGSFGYLNESFNGFTNNYGITQLALTDISTSLSTPNVIVGSDTRVNFRVTSTGADILAGEPMMFYHSYLPTSDIYTDNPDDFADVWVYESLRQGVGFASTSGLRIINCTITAVSAKVVDVQYDLTFTVADKLRLEQDYEYVLACGIGDTTLTTAESNKVTLKIKRGNYIKSSDIPGLMITNEYEAFDHPTDFVSGSGYTTFLGWIEDGILLNHEFDLDRNLSAVLESYNVKAVAYKSSDNTFFELQSVSVDLSEQITDTDGNQFIDFDGSRAFPLAVGDQFNYNRIASGVYETNGVGLMPYSMQCGIKWQWQEWLELPNADPIFLDTNEPLNNLNKKVSNYLANGYDLRLMVEAVISQDGIESVYQVVNSTCEIYDYEKEDVDPAEWACTIETFKVSGANLNGAIASNENTRILATFTPTTVDADINDYYGILRIEEELNPGFQIVELSTMASRPPQASQSLIPLTGETRTKFTKVGVGVQPVTLECIIDVSAIDTSIPYKLSSRLGLIDSSSGVVPSAYDQTAYDSGYS